MHDTFNGSSGCSPPERRAASTSDPAAALQLRTSRDTQPLPALATKPYLTPAEVADLLGVSEKTVSRWSLEDASMPVFRRGRVVRFPRERLIAWLERQEPRTARRQAQLRRN